MYETPFNPLTTPKQFTAYYIFLQILRICYKNHAFLAHFIPN